MRPPEKAIRAEIAERGPMRFDRFMELALYGPGGFYDEPPVGAGDRAAFATSPHVHEVFGALLAAAVRDLHAAAGDTAVDRLIEVGAGDGTLAARLQPALADLGLRYIAVERSSGARRILREHGLEVADALEDVAPGPAIVVANELLDNLPFRRFRCTAGGFREITIRVGEDARLVEELSEAPHLTDPALRGGSDEGDEVLVPVGARALVATLARTMTRGFAVLIDYGSIAGTPGEVHGYRGQRVIQDVLHEPGASDITAGVDFDDLGQHAQRVGLRVLGAPTQHAALRALGLERWLHDELARQQGLLDRRDGLEAVRTWSGRSRATLLADPAGLGRLRWLVLAAGEVAAATWLGRARELDGARS